LIDVFDEFLFLGLSVSRASTLPVKTTIFANDGSGSSGDRARKKRGAPWRRDYTGEGTLRLNGGLNGGDAHQRRLRSGVAGSGGAVAGGEGEGRRKDSGEQDERAVLKHGDLRKRTWAVV
jgi:hypothetical protein